MSVNKVLYQLLRIAEKRLGKGKVSPSSSNSGGRLFDGQIRHAHDEVIYSENSSLTTSSTGDTGGIILLGKEKYEQIAKVYNFLLAATDIKTAKAYVAQITLQAMKEHDLINITEDETGFSYHITDNMKTMFRPLFEEMTDEQIEQELFFSLNKSLADFGFESDNLKKLAPSTCPIFEKASENALVIEDLKYINQYLQDCGLSSIKAADIANGSLIQLEGLERLPENHMLRQTLLPINNEYYDARDLLSNAYSVYSIRNQQESTRDPRAYSEKELRLVRDLNEKFDTTFYMLQLKEQFTQYCNEALSKIEAFIRKNYDSQWVMGNEAAGLDKKQQESFNIFTNLYLDIQRQRDSVEETLYEPIDNAQKNNAFSSYQNNIKNAISESSNQPSVKEFSGFFAGLKAIFDRFISAFKNRETQAERSKAINEIKEIITKPLAVKEDDEREHPHR